MSDRQRPDRTNSVGHPNTRAKFVPILERKYGTAGTRIEEFAPVHDVRTVDHRKVRFEVVSIDVTFGDDADQLKFRLHCPLKRHS